ncbi:MAG: aminoglycoside phosphotransferase family protein [Proteobacteria bacterium]|nr:aminoglycoside phosphotransferase family protein [Pseudomonadota bacterium]MBU1595274.1 aminoglycoside phosphotransferase family protein [Pseudomonadota bacterium]
MRRAAAPPGPVIGLDLDNTLVGYDELLCELAVSEGLLAPPGPGQALGLGKRALRDALRARGDAGEQDWRRLQALIYGTHMPRARLMPGVADFLARCARLKARGADFELYIVSHKTRYANNYSDGADFHAAALDFLAAHGFFTPGTGLAPAQVFFEPDREAKVARIAALGCTHFVDDLEETFAEPGFPAGVLRILLDPAGDAQAQPGVTRLGAWAEISDALLADLEPVPGFAALAGEAVVSCQRIYGGRNSRVYRVATASGRILAGKRYHRHQDDPRDRLGAEWRALTLLADRGVERVARPAASDPAQGLALYTFLDGPQASASPATAADMDACLDFLAGLKGLGAQLTPEQAQTLPAASEACFSLAELAANLRSRLAALDAVPPTACLGAELAAFLAAELKPFLEASLARAAALLGDPEQRLARPRLTLSPSDFGLHNALRTPTGLCFVDFEYFGWDDPAKTLCDFVLHPAMGLAQGLRERFAGGFLASFGAEDSGLPKRVAAVYPLYGIKWCLILLNEFLRAADARRRFAAAASCVDDDLTRRSLQLGKARAMLDLVRTTHAAFPGLC